MSASDRTPPGPGDSGPGDSGKDPSGVPLARIEPARVPADQAVPGEPPGPGQDDPTLPSRTARTFIWSCLGLVAALVVWAAVGELDVVSTATGLVIPSTKVKTVQHLEGGIIREILVREGDVVESGQPLVVLEETASGSSVEELEVRITSLTAEVARLEAEAEGLDEPDFPEDLREHHPELVQQVLDFFRSRRSSLESARAEQRENVIQRTQDILEIEARLDSARRNLELLREQIAISEELLKDKLTSRYQHLAFLKEETKLKSLIEEDKVALTRARSSLVEAKARLGKLGNEFREDARRDLQRARQDLEEFTQRMRKLTDSLQRTTIRSPVKGIIKRLYFVTRGGVVRPGDAIVDVVPSSDRLVVEAHLPISDIGFVQPGQEAVVKLASADAGRFGKIDGEVLHVSPDAFTTPEGRTFYTVRIVTEQGAFMRGDFEYALIPGMQVVAYIHTGKRTVLGYLLDPFLDSMDQALQER